MLVLPASVHTQKIINNINCTLGIGLETTYASIYTKRSFLEAAPDLA